MNLFVLDEDPVVADANPNRSIQEGVLTAFHEVTCLTFIDLTIAGAKHLGFYEKGLTKVKLEVISK